MGGAHSILPPSGAKAWRKCALWVEMNRRYPKEDSEASRAGTAAHWVWEQALQGIPMQEGLVAENGVVVDDEMIEGARLFIDTLRSFDILEGVAEGRVEIPRIHPECFGTPDVWDFKLATWELHVVDYKFGHRFVDEYENDQLVCYTAGLLDKLADKLRVGVGILDQKVTVKMTVVQPRCYYKGSPVRTWSVQASDLRGQISHLRGAAYLATQPNASGTVNSECRDCPGRHACPALQRVTYGDLDLSERSLPVELSPEDAALELRYIERGIARMEARADGLREQLTLQAKSGVAIPHYRLEQSYGRTAWSVPAEQVIAMGQMFGKDLAKLSTLTPAQAKKIGIDEAVIKAYSSTPLGAIKLVPDDTAGARRVFG